MLGLSCLFFQLVFKIRVGTVRAYPSFPSYPSIYSIYSHPSSIMSRQLFAISSSTDADSHTNAKSDANSEGNCEGKQEGTATAWKRTHDYEFLEFGDNRDWRRSTQFWQAILQKGSSRQDIPSFVARHADREYGLTNLSDINAIGERSEFQHNDQRYKKKQTLAIQLGYVGTEYRGYEQQKNIKDRTVEADIKIALRRDAGGGKGGYKLTAAGRTDKV